MNAPQKISSLLVAPGVALVRAASTVSVRARKRAGAKWLKAMCARSSKPSWTIRELIARRASLMPLVFPLVMRAFAEHGKAVALVTTR